MHWYMYVLFSASCLTLGWILCDCYDIYLTSKEDQNGKHRRD